MKNYLPFLQIAVSALLIIFVLLQQRGTALGSSFGGSGGYYATRRGIQKKILWATVVLGTILIILSVINLTL